MFKIENNKKLKLEHFPHSRANEIGEEIIEDLISILIFFEKLPHQNQCPPLKNEAPLIEKQPPIEKRSLLPGINF